ncbi:hypothetical protein LTR02_004637 [Friedmanniomyces endolithicus]|nr:hypothetical protein LTR94_012115 [Friedmanniomyces endolithicus]KAK0808673.1 hypothetical protein LTR59_002826 [Friedmanniomyces endolithicus]KAK0813094.1 hypothetical protein LTR38_003169 [Friedmanniomyces endolithicus]KAK0820038.1 hypothetical protein LTR75_001808 [Friedmanniomyces endolithicus]KAK0834427.1 hypothetical protein LTR03_014318 [Friedmanniomyces endolithicus]
MSPQETSTTIRAHLCGRRYTLAIPIPHDGSNTDRIEEAMCRQFGIDERSYQHTLLWHFRAEPCHVQRPLVDLIGMAVSVPEVLRRESLRVHVCRMVRLVEGPGDPAVGGGLIGGVAVGLAVAGAGGAGGAGTVAGGSGEVKQGGTDVVGQARTEHLDGETELHGEETEIPNNGTTRAGREREVSGGEATVASGNAATAGRATTGSDDEATASNADTTASGKSAGDNDEDAGLDEDADEPADRCGNHAVHGEPSAADEVAFHLRWSPDTSQQFGLVPHTFSNIRTLLDTDLVDIRERIRDEIVRFLRKSPQLRDHFRDTIAICYRAVVGNHTGGHDVVDLEDPSYGGRFEAVSDLFVDPATAPRSVNVTITLLPDDGSDYSPAAKKRKMSKVSAETFDLDQLVQSTQDDVNPRRRFVRLGEVSKREINDPDDIPEEFPILAEIDRQQRTLIFLWETRAWDFDDFCIGGFELCKKTLRFSQRLLWFNGYHGVKSKSQLQDRISARVTTDRRMPFLPPLTFNAFDPDEYDPPLGTGVINKKYGVVVVIRFVSHLPKAETERLAFHKNFQLVVGDSDDYESIAKEVNTELESADETKRLSRAEYKDRWQLQLWAMPHEPAPRTLFRFEPSDSEEVSSVKRFTSARMLKRKHGSSKLYMEAHLWEVDDDEEQQLVRHHAESTGHAGPEGADVGEDHLLDGLAPARQGRPATKKRRLTRTEGANDADRTPAQERAGISALPHNDPEDASDQAGSATDGEELRDAAVREQYRLLFEDEQRRLAMGASEQEVLWGLPRDDSLSWDALYGEDVVGAGKAATDCGSKEYEDGDGGGGDRVGGGQDPESQDEDAEYPPSRHEVDPTKAARAEDEQQSSENSEPEHREGWRAAGRAGKNGEIGEADDDDSESSWLLHVPESLREEQRRQ